MALAMADLVILGIILISSLIGFFRGLIKEALSLASWFAAIFIAGLFSAQLSDLMGGLIDSDTVRRVAAFALLFIMTIFVGTLVGNLVSKLTSAIGLGGIDRVLGMVFGLIRGVIVVLLAVLITIQFEFTLAWYEGALLVPYAVQAIEYLQTLFGVA